MLRDISKLVTGTAAGKLIIIATMPLATRLYSPDDFALLAVYMALISIISVAACLRFEIAIPLAKNVEQAADLLIISLIFSSLISLIAFIIALVAPNEVSELIGKPAIAPYLWLVGLGVLCISLYSMFQYWATRKRQFGVVAKTRVGQAITGTTTLLVLGYLGFIPLGLMLGNMLNVGAGGVRLATKAIMDDWVQFKSITTSRLRKTFKENWRFPIYSTPEAITNIAAVQIPILIIASYAGAEAGQLYLAMLVMAAPMSLIGSSISQVYVSRAPEEFCNDRLEVFTTNIMIKLFMVGIVPIVVAAFLSPLIFPLIFGPEWLRAGQIVSWIAPWMLVQLVVSPVSMALHITNNQSRAMLLQVFGLFLRVGMVAVIVLTMKKSYVEIYAVSGFIFYIIYGLVVIYSIKK